MIIQTSRKTVGRWWIKRRPIKMNSPSYTTQQSRNSHTSNVFFGLNLGKWHVATRVMPRGRNTIQWFQIIMLTTWRILLGPGSPYPRLTTSLFNHPDSMHHSFQHFSYHFCSHSQLKKTTTLPFPRSGSSLSLSIARLDSFSYWRNKVRELIWKIETHNKLDQFLLDLAR